MDTGGVLRGVFAAALPRVSDTRHFALSVFGKVKNNGVAASGKDALRKGCHFAVRCGFASSEERHAGRYARYLTGSEFEIRKGAGRRDVQSQFCHTSPEEYRYIGSPRYGERLPAAHRKPFIGISRYIENVHRFLQSQERHRPHIFPRIGDGIRFVTAVGYRYRPRSVPRGQIVMFQRTRLHVMQVKVHVCNGIFILRTSCRKSVVRSRKRYFHLRSDSFGGTAAHRADSCRYPSCRMRTEAAIILKTRAFSYLGILKHIRERGFQLRRSQCDTAVMPQKDIFAGRRRGIPARIVHVIQADAALRARNSTAYAASTSSPRWHLRRQSSRCSVCSGSRRDTVRGRSARPKRSRRAARSASGAHPRRLPALWFADFRSRSGSSMPTLRQTIFPIRPHLRRHGRFPLPIPAH